MGANAQTSVPLFVANSVLTAAQQNISAATGVPVFATTVTRDAAFGGSNKVLAEGQLCYIEASDVVQYYTGAAWATVGPATASGLNLVSATTIGSAVGSVTISSAFSATYDAYKVILSGGVSSLANEDLRLTLGATATGYYIGGNGANYAAGTANLQSTNNGAFWGPVGYAQTTGCNISFELQNPFLSSTTYYSGMNISTGGARNLAGYLSGTTSYTAFTITVAAGTLTGGTVRVYGYQNS